MKRSIALSLASLVLLTSGCNKQSKDNNSNIPENQASRGEKTNLEFRVISTTIFPGIAAGLKGVDMNKTGADYPIMIDVQDIYGTKKEVLVRNEQNSSVRRLYKLKQGDKITLDIYVRDIKNPAYNVSENQVSF